MRVEKEDTFVWRPYFKKKENLQRKKRFLPLWFVQSLA